MSWTEAVRERPRASDLIRQLKHAYEVAYQALSSKEEEVSALLSENELVSNHLSTLQQDYNVLVRNKKGEEAQDQKFQQGIDDLKVLVQKTNHELERSRAEAAGSATQQVQTAEKLQQSVDALKVKDDAIGRLQAQAVAAEKKPQKALKLKDNEIDKLAENNLLSNSKLKWTVDGLKLSEIQRLKDAQYETNQKRRRVSSTANVRIAFAILCLGSH